MEMQYREEGDSINLIYMIDLVLKSKLILYVSMENSGKANSKR